MPHSKTLVPFRKGVGRVIQLLTRILWKTPLYEPSRRLIQRVREKRELKEWERTGRPAPSPHIVKQRTLRAISREFDLRILVETGTFHGEMVEALKDDFEYICSIELSSRLFQRARRRFERDTKVELIHGDSGVELKKVVTGLAQPTLFWLDAHYSAGVTGRGEKDTPVVEELGTILQAQGVEHVILIDDARCFGADPSYPSFSELLEFIKTKRPDYCVQVVDDIIRVLPNQIGGAVTT